MPSESDLRRVLQRIDSRGYKAYNDIKGRYDFECFTLFVDYVQRDPFAPPSQMRVRIDQDRAGFDESLFNTKSREVALRDFLTRRFSDAAYRICKANRGTGNSGVISIDRPGQEVLRRTSAFVTKEYIEVRFVMGLPAYGRKVASKHAEEMLLFELPEIVRASLYFENLDEKLLIEHLEVVEDADFLRDKLYDLGLVAFVADGAILPRASGVDPRPMKKGQVVPFKSPDSLRVEVVLPNRGKIEGMGAIPAMPEWLAVPTPLRAAGTAGGLLVLFNRILVANLRRASQRRSHGAILALRELNGALHGLFLQPPTAKGKLHVQLAERPGSVLVLFAGYGDLQSGQFLAPFLQDGHYIIRGAASQGQEQQIGRLAPHAIIGR